ncbi:hypothetical protein MKW98_005530 [Papaver atlanticum]|uniref:Uncharacterized protein n=1 Tax=Papaver atlanticum TaxID=357466 RepID=A0AAD4XT12_9MAGN|nr:hypothetical protein MKW98_005530 [Papaver atlanticum]
MNSGDTLTPPLDYFTKLTIYLSMPRTHSMNVIHVLGYFTDKFKFTAGDDLLLLILTTLLIQRINGLQMTSFDFGMKEQQPKNMVE